MDRRGFLGGLLAGLGAWLGWPRKTPAVPRAAPLNPVEISVVRSRAETGDSFGYIALSGRLRFPRGTTPEQVRDNEAVRRLFALPAGFRRERQNLCVNADATEMSFEILDRLIV